MYENFAINLTYGEAYSGLVNDDVVLVLGLFLLMHGRGSQVAIISTISVFP